VKVLVAHLYPDYLNIYADRGNIAVLAQRLAWRGHQLEVEGVSMGDPLPRTADLFYIGGGQDREQALVAQEIAGRTDELREAVDGGAAALAVCGGYQLLGRYYRDTAGVELPGAGILPLHTIAGDTRMIGDVLLDCDGQTLAGFENHAGRTVLDEGAEPLGRVVHGFGNDGRSGDEGCRAGRVVGTYLHGPLLPRNPWFADWLLEQALSHRAGDEVRLERLPDELERRAQDVSAARARERGGRGPR
jgi:CobQ-like glutamine amidotransferase family enzyme